MAGMKESGQRLLWWRYEVLVNALNLRYGEEHMKQIYWSQLRNQTQKPGELIQQLAQDIERLTLLSYLTYNPQHREETALKSFTFESANQASRTDVKLRQICEECSCQKMVLEQKGQDYGGGKLMKANFARRKLAGKIDVPTTVIKVSRLHRSRCDL
ncbi:hypothetical protein HELRODRAFT_164159 [Helobdella robusta]|uniref:Uncharacterized protein n=1 Tax=Helobdella robusta TaxID=6412 RepID=T1EV07_HELRO|nr:hypothetical protein HELRODRAFT_164159 [Helobdella robusta]ESN94334.1 hypothetical protein HELRODRAFT_164159 [Helobdella robusta]